jgi:hypothetical protein
VELGDSVRAYKKPLAAISPDDMRGPQGEVSGLYTLVAPNMRWPNATVYWEYDAKLNNFSKIFINYPTQHNNCLIYN